MQKSKVLVAGASGALGREVVTALKVQGMHVRAFSRSEAKAAALRSVVDEARVADVQLPESMLGICEGVDFVISALGASVSTDAAERAPFSKVDAAVNRNLLAEAKRAGVKKFVYVSVFIQPAYAETRYIRAHEAFVDELKASGLEYAVVRPTGFFSAMEEFLPLAKGGFFPLFGGGGAKTNPIHNADLAQVCVAALQASEREIPAGGPDVLTRRQIGELAFAALGKKPRFIPLPLVLLVLGSLVLRLLHPRMSELLEFVAGISATDCVAPVRGAHRLADHYADVVQGNSSRSLEVG